MPPKELCKRRLNKYPDSIVIPISPCTYIGLGTGKGCDKIRVNIVKNGGWLKHGR